MHGLNSHMKALVVLILGAINSLLTSNNRRLESAFNVTKQAQANLDPRLSLFVMSSAPAEKSPGDARCASQDPSTHPGQVP